MVRSLITLKALTYEPTGGIVAAATTSLPEDIGGSRNWDYRYCWLRDATITLEALLRTGYTDEATAWRQWLCRAIAGDPADVQIMYGVAGERRLAEWEADWLPGYEGSAPGADRERRRASSASSTCTARWWTRSPWPAASGLPVDRHVWSLQRALLDFLEKHWSEPDEGIWEVRGPRRDFVHSKVMAWVAFDRARRGRGRRPARPGRPMAATARPDPPRGDGEGLQPRARRVHPVLRGGRRSTRRVLLMAELGFLPPSDPRLISTVDAIRRELTDRRAGPQVPAQHGRPVSDRRARPAPRAPSWPAASGSPTRCT